MVLCLDRVGGVDKAVLVRKSHNGTKVLIAYTDWLNVFEIKVGLVYSCPFVVVSGKDIETLLIGAVDDIMYMAYGSLRISIYFLYFKTCINAIYTYRVTIAVLSIIAPIDLVCTPPPYRNLWG